MDASTTDRGARYRRVAYYPGCALEGTAHAYNASTRAVGKALGLALDEVPNWNCCGAMEVKNIDPKVQTYLNGGAAPTFNYHRFWAQSDVATAMAVYGELFP